MSIPKNEINLIVFIALCWTILFVGNQYLFQTLQLSPYVSLIFIPAGLRLALSIIYRQRSILGLFLGAVITSLLSHELSLLHLLYLPLASAVEPFISLILIEKIYGHRLSFQWMSLGMILNISIVYAILCPLTHIGILYLFDDPSRHNYTVELLGMMLGDFLGASVFLVLTHLVIHWFNRAKV